MKPSHRPLILYAYSETASAHDNLDFFITHGLHGAADFLFIMNGETNDWQLLPNETNIRYVQRPNDCYDLGAYAEILQGPSPSDPKVPLYKSYKQFILLNASIRGPFLPYWAESCWSEIYLSKVTQDTKVEDHAPLLANLPFLPLLFRARLARLTISHLQLVGMTGNCWPQFHVQSMIWATDAVGVELLLFPPQPTPTQEIPTPEPVVGINSCFHTWDQAVNAEIHASKIITDAGYKLDLMMTAFHGIDKYAEGCDTSVPGDVLYNGHYHGTNVHPYETIFLKTNRGIDPVLMDRLTDWTHGRNYTSWDMC
ncbi:MAG: hypothetical protein M1818_000283 [Claussenomyces sp. TS43310]|nr:MAG: hypothetical protein M1818_000283 [Claussenomyces sp. TS43310]